MNQEEPAKIQIGKQGVTKAVVDEIKAQIAKKRVVKVRLLKSCVGEGDRKEIAAETAKKTGALLSDMRGYVFTLKRR